ncbi:hypothetical protein BC936DRAFT_143783 [Jimgerdemannia flammicorona]|uniref:Uncharacterized protein n=1 Tax=Jimgerdemannia flammicorona TaxID=994334 RepID=A0A433DDE4_9FUNG|nr:hypothetical protein BC936DRAFT_143783 [Jimgerdemannia flammicorona]
MLSGVSRVIEYMSPMICSHKDISKPSDARVQRPSHKASGAPAINTYASDTSNSLSDTHGLTDMSQITSTTSGTEGVPGFPCAGLDGNC